jgi:hypothetical protein
VAEDSFASLLPLSDEADWVLSEGLAVMVAAFTGADEKTRAPASTTAMARHVVVFRNLLCM